MRPASLLRSLTSYSLTPCVLIASFFFCQCAAFSNTLDDKLSVQFERYAAAQRNLVARVNDTAIPTEQRVVSRAEFETWLNVPQGMDLTSDDLAELRGRQQQMVAKSRERARTESRINLDALRKLDGKERAQTISKFCAAFPKGAMLHVHPSGSFPRDALAKMFRETNPVITAKQVVDDVTAPDSGLLLYPGELSWLKSLPAEAPFLSLTAADQDRVLAMTRLPEGSHPFERFDTTFYFLDFPFSVPETTWANYEALVRAFAERAAQEHVRYVEFTAGAGNAETFPLKQALLQRVSAATGVKIRLNASFSRWDTLENQRKIADYVLALKNPMVVGIDLLGNESGMPALEKGQVPYARVLHEVEAGNSRVHRTMHAGELGDERNPRDAMILGAERLGHAVALALDPVATEYARLHGVALEANLTSNQRLRAFEDISKHPFLTQLRLGIAVSLSTDDEGIFDTDINTECEKVIGLTDVQYSEMRALTLNSVLSSFLPDEEKQDLLKAVEADLVTFESGWIKF